MGDELHQDMIHGYPPYCFTLVRRWMADALSLRKCFDHLNPQVEHSLLCGRRRGRRFCPG